MNLDLRAELERWLAEYQPDFNPRIDLAIEICLEKIFESYCDAYDAAKSIEQCGWRPNAKLVSILDKFMSGES